MAIIKVALSATINQGDYNSIKIDVGFEDSIRDGETPQRTFDRVYGFVENKLQEKINEQHNPKSKTPVNLNAPVRKIKKKITSNK